ncbi:MAG: CopD family protein, partial [Aquihabitans sp.]
LVLLRSRLRKDDVVGAADAVARFSGIAGITLAVVLVTGTTLGWIEVGGLNALRTTTYGKLLMAKVATVGLVLIGATWNRFRLVPAIGRSAPANSTRGASEVELAEADASGVVTDTSPEAPSPLPYPKDPRWARFARVVGFEVGGLVVVLALTAVLANVTPAKTASPPGIIATSAPLGAGTVEVIVDPGKAGRNDVHAYVLDARGRLDGQYRSATFTLALPAYDIGPLARNPALVAPGHFSLVGADMVKGEWTLTVSVRPDRFTEQKAVVSFKIR